MPLEKFYICLNNNFFNDKLLILFLLDLIFNVNRNNITVGKLLYQLICLHSCIYYVILCLPCLTNIMFYY